MYRFTVSICPEVLCGRAFRTGLNRSSGQPNQPLTVVALPRHYPPMTTFITSVGLSIAKRSASGA